MRREKDWSPFNIIEDGLLKSLLREVHWKKHESNEIKLTSGAIQYALPLQDLSSSNFEICTHIAIIFNTVFRNTAPRMLYIGSKKTKNKEWIGTKLMKQFAETCFASPNSPILILPLVCTNIFSHLISLASQNAKVSSIIKVLINLACYKENHKQRNITCAWCCDHADTLNHLKSVGCISVFESQIMDTPDTKRQGTPWWPIPKICTISLVPVNKQRYCFITW